MQCIVGVIKGDNKFNSFEELLRIVNFDDPLSQEFKKSKKNKCTIGLSPNFFLNFRNRKEWKNSQEELCIWNGGLR